MHSHPVRAATLALALALTLGGCSDSDDETVAADCVDRGLDSATAGCLEPLHPPEYYVEQSSRYFDTLDSYVSPWLIPHYSELVARWEWPPWLYLTGLGAENLIYTDLVLKLFPTIIAERDCRFFPTQPFGRCRVVFDYGGLPCPIYEEFTFNDQGEMTFIEAWTDLPGLHPTDPATDPFAERPDVRRLATKLPGLGNERGKIDLYAAWMEEAAAADEDVAEFVFRARDPFNTWIAEVLGAEEALLDGCSL